MVELRLKPVSCRESCLEPQAMALSLCALKLRKTPNFLVLFFFSVVCLFSGSVSVCVNFNVFRKSSDVPAVFFSL